NNMARTSSRSSASSSAGGGGSLTALIAGIYAYFTTPVLTANGLTGIFGATMIGGGTALTAGLHAFGAGLAGAAVGAAFGAAAKNPLKGAFIGGGILAVLGFIYGIPVGYTASQD